MKKNILKALGIAAFAGILFGTPLVEAQAAHAGVGVNIRLGGNRHYYHRHNRHSRRHMHRVYRHSGLPTITTGMSKA